MGWVEAMEPRDVQTWIDGHEKLCASRYDAINKQLGSMTKIGSWAGGLAVAILISMLGWSLKTGYDREQADIARFQSATSQITATVKQTAQQSQGSQ